MNQRAGPAYGFGRIRLGAVIAVAVAAGLIAWLVLKQGNGDDSSAPKPSMPVATSVQDLRALEKSVGHPVYWAGQKRGHTYELTQTRDGRFYIRYLPPGVQIGDPRPNFLTVGTYPHDRALATLKRLAKREGAITKRLARGGLAVAGNQQTKSVYLAYSGEDLQIEVYAPSERARRLAVSGRVVPIR